MLKILSSEQIKEADQYTILHERISSTDLMERAALAFTKIFTARYHPAKPVCIFCGYGNNGGDGLAIARLLIQENYHVSVYLLADQKNYAPDHLVNLARLQQLNEQTIFTIQSDADIPGLPDSSIVIDALFGSGLNRPLSGLVGLLVEKLNSLPVIRVAVDIPSGLFADHITNGTVFKAHQTITFELPKLAFLFPENNAYTGHWEIASIGLHPDYIQSAAATHFLSEQKDIAKLVKGRQTFDHKGIFGHAYIHAGSEGKMGAAILCAKACLRTGAGLATVHAAAGTAGTLNTAIPEAMTWSSTRKKNNEDLWSRFSAAVFGPGIGTDKKASAAFLQRLKKVNVPSVFDADALNIIARQKKGLKLLPPNSIITPHLKEFERLAGSSEHWEKRHLRQLELSHRHSIFIVLKGAYTCITTPDQQSYFNPTGNPGMAKGGSGDVLTGMIAGLLAQQYPPLDACLLSVYLHGLAGDLAVKKESVHSLLASDIIASIGDAYRALAPEKT